MKCSMRCNSHSGGFEAKAKKYLLHLKVLKKAMQLMYWYVMQEKIWCYRAKHVMSPLIGGEFNTIWPIHRTVLEICATKNCDAKICVVKSSMWWGGEVV